MSYTDKRKVNVLFFFIFEVYYRSVPGKRPLPGKHPCTSFQGVNVAASIQTYGNYVPGKRPWALTRDTTVFAKYESASCRGFLATDTNLSL